MLSNLRSKLESLSSAEHDPGRTAASLAFGVFLSFSPFLGLQIVIGIGTAFLLRLSRLGVLVGLCANLPWIMLPWYAVTTVAAAAILGGPADSDIRARIADMLAIPVYHAAFWTRTSDLVAAFLLPFLVGPTCGALVLGTAAYAIAFRILSHRQQRLKAAEAFGSTRAPGDAQQGAADRHVHDSQRAGLEP
jgi:uncharacterized protein (DUF2062 family)